MLNRLKKILGLDKGVQLYDDSMSLSPEQAESLLDIVRDFYETPNEVSLIGEERGEFLSDMSDEEVLEYERLERLGWKDFKTPK